VTGSTKMIRAAVFDLDGTLLDTTPVIGELLSGVLIELGRPRSRADIDRTIGQPLESSVAGLLGTDVLDPLTTTAVARYRERFGERVSARGPDLLFPGVPEGLAALAGAGISCALVTSKHGRAAGALLAATGLASHFPVTVTDNMVAHGKPHPESAERAADALGVPAAECACVGDAVTDMMMAVAAGMIPVGVGYGAATPAELAAAGAATVARSFSDVTAFLLDDTDDTDDTDGRDRTAGRNGRNGTDGRPVREAGR